MGLSNTRTSAVCGRIIRVMEYFRNNPNKKLTLRQIKQNTNTPISLLKPKLALLIELGLIVKYKDDNPSNGSIKYYLK